jgi:hypothetical protein
MNIIYEYNPSYSESRGKKIVSLRSTWAKLARPYLTNKTQNQRVKGLGAHLKSVECLPSIHEALFKPRPARSRSEEEERKEEGGEGKGKVAATQGWVWRWREVDRLL